MAGNFCNNIAQSIIFDTLDAGRMTDYERKKLLALIGWEKDELYQITVFQIKDVFMSTSLMAYLENIEGKNARWALRETVIFVFMSPTVPLCMPEAKKKCHFMT